MHKVYSMLWLQMTRQHGATLLIVLMLTLVMALIAAIAIRSGSLGLRQARQSQIYTLLWQNSDAVLFALEDKQLINQPKAWQGVWDYFSDAQHAQHELVFCYDTSTAGFDVEKMAVIDLQGKGVVKSDRGFCQVDSVEQSTARVLSQFYIRKNDSRLVPFIASPLATSLGQTALTSVNQQFEVVVISILPQLGQQSFAEISTCLKQPRQQAQHCLSQLNTRFNLQQAIYTLSGSLKAVAAGGESAIEVR